MSSKMTKNNKILMYSIIFSIIFTVISLIVGFLTSSQVIIFDGVFTLVGTVLSYLSILSMKFIKKKDLRSYPFGKESLEPFIVISQYCIILFISITNILNAIQIILDGGRDTDVASGILYGIFTAIFNLIVFMYLKYLTKHNSTAMEKIELEQWRFSFLFGVAILVGFSVAWVMTKTSLLPYTVFVDPVLTIFITLVFMKTALLGIRSCVKELLLATPSEELTSFITEKINHINSQYNLSTMVLRLGKTGGQLIVEIDYIIEENSELDSIRAQDQLRTKIDKALKEVPYEKWLNVNFIGDIKWAGIS